MSLLIDALRKAEKDREQANPDPDSVDGLSLEPINAIPEPPQTLPPEAYAQREAAANLFEVKEDNRPQGRLVWLAVAGVLAGLCIGAYVWWQMQPVNTLLPASGQRAESTPLAVPSAPRPVREATLTPRAATAPASPAPAPAASAADLSAPPPSRTSPAAATARTSAAESLRRGDLGRRDMVEPVKPKPAENPPVRLARTRAAQLQVPGTLDAAYQAYSTGQLDKARALYTDYLRLDPNSVDALNGLGAIAMQQGRARDAMNAFEAALAANPGDPVAQAGLASVAPAADPVAEESRLRDRMDTSSDAPATQFALGNALAQQGRWSEAQAAYFDAHVADPGNPDYLFNLAVSLDQLAQPALARDYYQRALDAATRRAPAFDPAPVRARLAELGATAP